MSRFHSHLVVSAALFVVVVGLVLLSLYPSAPAIAQAGPSITPLSSLGGTVYCTAVSGTVAYMGQGDTFASFDVSNPSSIIRLSYTTLSYSCYKIQIRGPIAYVANGYGGLRIVDIGDPLHLKLLGSYIPASGVWDIAIANNRAYLVGDAFEIVDVSNPALPVLQGSYPKPNMGSFLKVDVASHYAYVSGDYELTVLDVADPVRPVKVAGLPNNYAYGHQVVRVSGNLLVQLTGEEGHSRYSLETFDISAPAAPRRLGNLYYDTFNVPVDNCCVLDVAGTYAYLTGSTLRLLVVDLTNPTVPAIVSTNPYYAIYMQVTGRRAFLVGLYGEIKVLDFDSSFRATEVGAYSEFADINDVKARASRVFGTDYFEELRVVDASSPGSPVLLPTNTYAGSGYNVALVGNHAYINGWGSGIGIYDIANPSQPVLLSRHNPAGHGSYETMTADGDYVYIGEVSAGLKIVDVHDPASPRQVGMVDSSTGISAESLRVGGNVLYVGSRPGVFMTVDVSNPAQPRILGRLNGVRAFGIDVVGTFAFAAATDGFYIIDASNPITPTIYAKYAQGGTRVKVVGNLAYMTNSNGLSIIDVTDLHNPKLYMHYDVPTPMGLDVAGDLIYIAARFAGLKILRLNAIPTAVTVSSFDAQANNGPNIARWLLALGSVCAIALMYNLWAPSAFRL